jgi:hypothetical protein
MKTTSLLLTLAGLAISSSALAQPSPLTPPAVNTGDAPIKTLPVKTGPHDGFFRRGIDSFIIRNGVITKMDREMSLPNGLRVLPDGRVTLCDGLASKLRETKLLNFEGAFEPLPASIQAAVSTPVPAAVKRAEKTDVGISSRDGIRVSGTDVFITRNGVTDKVTSDVKLANGVVAKPDGTVVMGDGRKITLRVDQLLGFDGVIHEAPADLSPAGPDPSSSSTQGN